MKKPLSQSCLTALCIFLLPAQASEAAVIVDVQRDVYVEQSEPGKTQWVSAYYVGLGLEREEIHTFMSKSDTPELPKRRRSHNNGRTWTELEELPPVVTSEQGARIYWSGGSMVFDEAPGVLLSIWLRQTHTDTYYNHSFSRISRDGGLTWSEPRFLRYEEGADFDPGNPLNPEYLNNNQAYVGNNTIRHSNGTMIHSSAAVNVPHVSETGKSYDKRAPADAKNIGSLCFLGRWNAESGDYDWTAGTPVWVPLEVSSRGLMEPEVAELSDGRVLVVWRGSSTPVTPGRKFFSVSSDGGMTLSPVAEWKYDDGTSFYSPSSFHRMFRHSTTGKLYWVGNICDRPPNGNSPRYPLVIAEVDESVPAVKRETVTIIDDRGPDDNETLQLSNFSLLEDRESRAVELYLTRLFPERDGWHGNAYKYVLTLK